MDEKKPKLLLADDSATIRKVVELTFADEGVEVFSATDSPAAMQRFVEVQPHIVLVDVNLNGGTNGYQICEMIKADAATRHIPVLLLVGSFEPFDQREAERVGADGFMTKPFRSIRDLVSRVSDLLKAEAGQATPNEPGTPTASPTADIDNLYLSSVSETIEPDEFEKIGEMLGDAGLDDELIETTYPDGDIDEEIDALTAEAKPDQGMKSFDSSADAKISDESEMVHNDFNPLGDLLDDLPFTPARRDGSFDSKIDSGGPVVTRNPEELSPEMIDTIAARVVEKLSDRVVRDIAKVEVPRIAEKLIREALEEESKS